MPEFSFEAANFLDWVLVAGFLALTLAVGLYCGRRHASSSEDFFLSGRRSPWWLLGFSMVATTFSTDVPNLVTDMVRTGGVAMNWNWWAFLLTGMLTTFVFARLWRNSGVRTDLEFYEIRYGGKEAAFLRGFRAVYLGLIFNLIVMAAVSLSAIKIGGALLDLKPWETIVYASIITGAFSVFGGLQSVLATDFLLFIVAMAGAFGAAFVSIDKVGGLKAVLENPLVQGKMEIFPSLAVCHDGAWDKGAINALVTLFLMPILVQWWSAWYPGSEPGGGGYITQRMLAAKDSENATKASFFFNFAHYAIRPWPWIIVALCSLLMFPTLESLQAAFPKTIAGHDLAYPAMLTLLPHGLKGLVIASLLAAYISTISTHLNWGASYLTFDFYKRFIRKDATEAQMVRFGRFATLFLMVVSALMSFCMKSSGHSFRIIVGFGAGTGLIFILRWFWWRINAWCEISAMTLSLIISTLFIFWEPAICREYTFLPYLINVAVTSLVWLALAYLAPATDKKTLRSFCRLTAPGGPGWRQVIAEAKRDGETIGEGAAAKALPVAFLASLLASAFVFLLLFATGHYIYGRNVSATIMTLAGLACGALLWKIWPKMKLNEK